jgi:hypothetical protein
MKYEIMQAFIESKIPFTYTDKCSFSRDFIILEHRSTRVANLLYKAYNIVQNNSGEIEIYSLADNRIQVSIFKQ